MQIIKKIRPIQFISMQIRLQLKEKFKSLYARNEVEYISMVDNLVGL